MIPEAHHAKPFSCQKSRAFIIIFFLLLMMPTIDFDDQLWFQTAKINDIVSNRMLTAKTKVTHLMQP